MTHDPVSELADYIRRIPMFDSPANRRIGWTWDDIAQRIIDAGWTRGKDDE